MKSIDSFRPLEKEQFMVDVISSKKCNKCGLQISDSAGIILKSGEISFSHFHLDCYDPQNKSRVFKDNFVCAIPVEWTSERQSFITWLKYRNKSFPIPKKPKIINIRTEGRLSRALKEIFKFLSAEECISVSRVNREWYTVSLSKEIWAHFWSRDYLRSADSVSDIIQEYFNLYINCCMECHKRVGNQKMCPLLLRKLCKKCRTQNYSISYKYNLIELSQAQAMYGFHDHWIRINKVKSWKIGKEYDDYTYNLLIQKKLDLVYQKLKLVIVKELFINLEDELKEFVLNFGINYSNEQEIIWTKIPVKFKVKAHYISEFLTLADDRQEAIHSFINKIKLW